MNQALTYAQWKREVKSRGQCARCPRTERLHAHHKDRDRTNNVLSNGELLCVWCHDTEHGGTGKIIAFDEASRRGRAPSNKGVPMSEEQKAKRRDVQLSEEHKRKIKEALQGKPKSDEHRRKLSEAAQSRVPWNKGKHTGQVPWNKGKAA